MKRRESVAAIAVAIGAWLAVAAGSAHAQAVEATSAAAQDDDPSWTLAKQRFDAQFAAYRAAVAREAEESAAAKARFEADQAAYQAALRRVAEETARIESENRQKDAEYRAAMAAYYARYGPSAARDFK